MHRTDREWALGVMGLDASYSDADLDRATTELQELWTPHAQSTNPKVQLQGQEELDKIDKARAILQTEQEAPAETERERSGLQPVVLGTLIAAAFIVGFGGMYFYRATHRPEAHVVIPHSLLASAPKVRLDAPDVSVSSQRIGPPPLSLEDQESIQDAIAHLGDDEPSGAMNDLESMGEKSIPALTAALSSRDDNVRMNATTVLNSIAAGPDDAPNTPEDQAKLRPIFDSMGTVTALERLSNDTVDDTRQNVAYALGNIGDASAFDTLIKMSNDYEPSVRAGAGYSLGKLKNPDAVPTLSALLEDSDPSVRMTAATALGNFQTDEARSALKDRLADETDSDVIASIQAALGNPSDTSEDGQGA